MAFNSVRMSAATVFALSWFLLAARGKGWTWLDCSVAVVCTVTAGVAVLY
jgi:hypothetical protein